MKKHWTQLENPKHLVHKLRHEFLIEHQNADELILTKEGIPVKATYFSPETPGNGKTFTDVPVFNKPDLKDIK